VVGTISGGTQFEASNVGGSDCWASIGPVGHKYYGYFCAIMLNASRYVDPVSGKVYVVKATTTPYLNVRSGPGTGYKDVGDLYPGEQFEVINIHGKSAWAQIKDGKFAGMWTAVNYEGIRFCDPI
jgi:uncharacterized protein YgiM (DUF1202 family)